MSTRAGVDDLLTAALSGDKKAEDELFSNLRARILGLVQQRIWNPNREASENRKDAEDLTQDICRTIWEKYKTPDFRAHFFPSAFAVTRNKIGDYFRRNQVRHKIETPVDDREILAVTDGNPEHQQQVWEQELESMLFRALEKLRPAYRPIARAFLEGRIREYVAEKKRTTPPGTVDSQIYRYRQELLKLLRAEGFEE